MGDFNPGVAIPAGWSALDWRTAMDLKHAGTARASLSAWARLRLGFWSLMAARTHRIGVIDPASLPDRMLDDLGLPRPNRAWDESVGFWRDR